MLKRSGQVFVFLCIGVLFIANAVLAQSISKDSSRKYVLDGKDVGISARLQTGYLTGEGNEIVYQASNSNRLLSHLIWEIDSLYMVGAGASFHQKWLALHFDYWTRATDGNGTMDDYDWLVSGSDWSDWSHHENTDIVNANIFDISAEVIVPKVSNDRFVLSGYLGFKYDGFKWRSKGGSYVYSTLGFRDDIGTFPASAVAISYDQAYETPYLGIGVRGVSGDFEFSGRLLGSLWAKLRAEDDHHMRNLRVIEDLDEGQMISCDLNAAYNFSEKVAIELGYNYTKYDEFRGDSVYTYGNGTVLKYINGGGADLETSMIKATLSYTF